MHRKRDSQRADQMVKGVKSRGAGERSLITSFRAHTHTVAAEFELWWWLDFGEIVFSLPAALA